jgi:hypothetical protein
VAKLSAANGGRAITPKYRHIFLPAYQALGLDSSGPSCWWRWRGWKVRRGATLWAGDISEHHRGIEAQGGNNENIGGAKQAANRDS